MLFFEELVNLNLANKNRIATIIQGPHIGAKAIYVNDSLYDSQGAVELFKNVSTEAIEADRPMLEEIDGEQVFFESMRSDPQMVICGGGHISIPVIKMAKMLDFTVTVLEDRPMFADNARRAGADRVICDAFEKGLEQIKGDKDTYFVIVTRGHRYDVECLTSILSKPHTYIGMIGSKKRVKAVKDLMEEKGFSRELIDSIYSPIGLNIGAETPTEIGVAILAEIIQVKNEQKGTVGYTNQLMSYIKEDWKETKFPVAVVTIISRKGSAPRGIGTKMLVVRTGQMIGTIGGGCAEASIQQIAIQCMEEGKSRLVNVDMTGREAEDDGMVCGGIIEVFIDCHQLYA